jgi:hypothetical protein
MLVQQVKENLIEIDRRFREFLLTRNGEQLFHTQVVSGQAKECVICGHEFLQRRKSCEKHEPDPYQELESRFATKRSTIRPLPLSHG